MKQSVVQNMGDHRQDLGYIVNKVSPVPFIQS